MRAKSLAMLMLALGCGLVASIGITQVMAKRNTEPRLPGETQAVFVATMEIPLGEPLSAQMLKLEPWPKDKVPPGAISKIEDIEGRRVRTRLYPGEPVLQNKLLSKGASEQGASSVIPKGYRVVTVRVDSVIGGPGLILPGDRVDVMVYLVEDKQRGIPETTTRTILQDVKVFAVNEVVDLEREKEKDKTIVAKTISLLATPQQAAKIALASELGKIRLVMRSPEDDEKAEVSDAKPLELLGLSDQGKRGDESLMKGQKVAAEVPAEKKPGFIDFLNTVRDKLATQEQPAQAPPKPDTWTVRILKPEGVDEVVLESEKAQSAAGGNWRQVSSTQATPSATPSTTSKSGTSGKAGKPASGKSSAKSTGKPTGGAKSGTGTAKNPTATQPKDEPATTPTENAADALTPDSAPPEEAKETKETKPESNEPREEKTSKFGPIDVAPAPGITPSESTNETSKSEAKTTNSGPALPTLEVPPEPTTEKK